MMKNLFILFAIASVAPLAAGFAPAITTARRETSLQAWGYTPPPAAPAAVVEQVVPSLTMAAADSSAPSTTATDGTQLKALLAKETALQKQVQRDEREAARDAKAAKIERSRKAFFEYEATAAAEEEARIEAAERKAKLQAEKDLLEVKKLQEAERKAEQAAKDATTQEERLKQQAQAKVRLVVVCCCCLALLFIAS